MRSAELAQRYRLQVDVGARIWQLSVGEQQRVEILRLLYRGARVLIFDEPTAVLTPQESAELVGTLRHMAASGFCIIFISHKLDEVLAVADRITVLRRGKVVASTAAADSDRRSLARMMIGRDIVFDHDPRAPAAGATALEVRGLQARGDKGLPALRGVDLDVRSGEILGIAGVAGNGQRELAETIAGLRPATGGSVRVAGIDRTNRAADEIVAAGVAHIPEDRLGTGLIASLGLDDNLILKRYRSTPLARGLFLDGRAIDAFARQLVQSYDVMPPVLGTRVGLLSGGNQQKLLLARELSGDPRVIVAVHPTRGVDVGASVAIQRLLLAQRRRGAAILLISEDLDELLTLADRVAVLFEGRIMGTLPAANADVEHIGLMMAGA